MQQTVDADESIEYLSGDRQARRQDFEWGGALRILTPHPKLANRWGARGSGSGR